MVVRSAEEHRLVVAEAARAALVVVGAEERTLPRLHDRFTFVSLSRLHLMRF